MAVPSGTICIIIGVWILRVYDTILTRRSRLIIYDPPAINNLFMARPELEPTDDKLIRWIE